MPRGLLGTRSSIAARFEAAQKSAPAKTSGTTEIAWTWHEEEERSLPLLLPVALKNNFADGALIRVKFVEKPDVPFFVRANDEYYSDRLKTGAISITKSILNAVGIPGNDKRAMLEHADESAAMLKQMVMVISNVFLSKRDLWHLQLAMMQQRGRIIYCGYSQNFSEHVPKSSIEKLLGMDGKPIFCGSVGVKTDVVFRSSSAHMFLLIEVSADLFQYGLMGLPYWQILLDCLGQCIERVCVASGTRMSHYIRVLLFARRKPTVGVTPLRSASSTRKEFSAYGPPENHQDYYDVIFEGYASAMPSPHELRSRVSAIFLTLLEEEKKYQRDPEEWVRQQKETPPDQGASPWGRMRAGELVESEQGNFLECLNLALNHFDQHHLDRLLKVSGQVVVIMTAGCGLIRTRSKELYLLTNRRCIAAGHTSFRLVGVKDPPWHRVPWIQWPGGPTFGDLVVPSQPPEWEGDRLSPFPSWLSYIPYQEAVFCPCLDNKDWVKAGFLPLLDSPVASSLPLPPVPHWNNEICTLQEQPKRAMQALPELSPKSMPSFPDSGPALRSFRISSNQKTWDEIRLPRLRAHLSKSKQICDCYAPVTYSVNPERFQSEGAKLELMYDLVGLRLAALGGTQVAFHDGVLLADEPEVGKPEQLQPWQVHGSLLPTSLHDLTVQAACGSEWRFKPQATDLMVSRTERFKMDRDKATSYLYEQFFVHLSSAWKTSQWIESRCVFHLQERLDWNFLDHVLAGVYHIPPALPYPVDRGQLADHLLVPRRDSSTTSFAGDTRDGWQLRGALKQHMLILMPKSSLASSHSELMKCVLAKLGGGITIGKDPFDAFDEAGTFEKNQDLLLEALLERQARVTETQSDAMSLPSTQVSRTDMPERRPQSWSESTVVLNYEIREEPEVSRVTSGPEETEITIQDELSPLADSQQLLEEFASVHKGLMKQFESFQAGFKKLCFGRLPPHQFEKESMGIDTSMKHFTVGRAEKTVSVREAELETSFQQSRDWFGIFYDDVYSPPKSFHMVVEWIACSSVHMASFFTTLDRLAARHNFKLLRLPIGVLFPQPAPAWVWSSDQETNFDRLPFYPRNRISLPSGPLPREKIYARLLQAWLQPPLKFHFIFASPIQDFKAYPIVAEEDAKEKTSAKKEVYQRLKGWVLCDSDGLCLATLREDCIYFFENHLQIYGFRVRERVDANLKKAERVARQFFQITTEVFDSIRESDG